MTIISVPYHLDEYLPDLDLPVEPDEVVTAEFPPGAPWERLAVLYDAVAGTVAADVSPAAVRSCSPSPAPGSPAARPPGTSPPS